MARIRTVGIRELKSRLSAYLKEASAGTTIVVTDRNEVVAQIKRMRSDTTTAWSENPVIQAWIACGDLIPPEAASSRNAHRVVARSPLRLDHDLAEQLLDRERGS